MGFLIFIRNKCIDKIIEHNILNIKYYTLLSKIGYRNIAETFSLFALFFMRCFAQKLGYGISYANGCFQCFYQTFLFIIIY